MVGAPGYGDDVGAVYIIFGGSTFSESYSLGSLGAESGITLIAPSAGGYAGFSVSGAGEHGVRKVNKYVPPLLSKGSLKC